MAAAVTWSIALTLAFAVSLASAVPMGPINSDGDSHELGDSVGVTAEMRQSYEGYLTKALESRGAAPSEAKRLTQQNRQLGESALNPNEKLSNLKKKAMMTAIKILEMENQRSKLVAENTMNADKVSTFSIAQKVMQPDEYKKYHDEHGAHSVNEKNQKHLEKEKAQMEDIAKKDFKGKWGRKMVKKIDSDVQHEEQSEKEEETSVAAEKSDSASTPSD